MDGKSRPSHDPLTMSCMLHHSPKSFNNDRHSAGGQPQQSRHCCRSMLSHCAALQSLLHERHAFFPFPVLCYSFFLFFPILALSVNCSDICFCSHHRGGDNGVGCFPGGFMEQYSGMVLVAHCAWSIWVKKIGWSWPLSCCRCVWRSRVE